MQADVERLLAQLLVNRDLRERFLLNPKEIARRHGLSEEECSAIDAVSAPSLQTAAQSYGRKRSFKEQHGKSAGLKRWLKNRLTAAIR